MTVTVCCEPDSPQDPPHLSLKDDHSITVARPPDPPTDGTIFAYTVGFIFLFVLN